MVSSSFEMQICGACFQRDITKRQRDKHRISPGTASRLAFYDQSFVPSHIQFFIAKVGSSCDIVGLHRWIVQYLHCIAEEAR